MGKCECSVNPADEDAPNAAGAWEAGYCDYLFMGWIYLFAWKIGYNKRLTSVEPRPFEPLGEYYNILLIWTMSSWS